ncbi:hypothetical protein Nhal_1748 [Nitrosococcus halophilus Nc 4]|uniref:Uncharacterized protein n=1 Tax=Nitrosococcus halophilus (strain Nc4) TaxID=472759 RepID=D5C2Y0_NITHN|nr:hypothetical protein Nhal_1748 [Nitrosococcus halophilus Nc 4]
MHRATNRFWEWLEKLPEEAQILARKNFSLLRTNPQYPSLHFKKVGKFWPARVGLNYRALAVETSWKVVGIKCCKHVSKASASTAIPALNG